MDEAATIAARVGCELTFELESDVALVLQVAVDDRRHPPLEEALDVSTNGRPVDTREVHDVGGRLHLVRSPAGTLRVSYRATVSAPTSVPTSAADTFTSAEVVDALRPSRYCPSDLLERLAQRELGHLPASGRAQAVADWVATRIEYTSGSSRPTDGAVDTLLLGAGVCRDFAHVTAALCRALGTPARLVAAYAPGLSPMDFHAVVEAHEDGAWQLVDATRLAPRQSLVRIWTGRDAADTAFATTLEGRATFVGSDVFAITEGDLPVDDHRGSVLSG